MVEGEKCGLRCTVEDQLSRGAVCEGDLRYWAPLVVVWVQRTRNLGRQVGGL
jgi:hypothetical protein